MVLSGLSAKTENINNDKDKFFVVPYFKQCYNLALYFSEVARGVSRWHVLPG
jgi:hypothetical protein